jgi:hypothetical protein
MQADLLSHQYAPIADFNYLSISRTSYGTDEPSYALDAGDGNSEAAADKKYLSIRPFNTIRSLRGDFDMGMTDSVEEGRFAG